VDVETCVAPAEDFLHKGKADEIFPEKQGEDLMGGFPLYSGSSYFHCLTAAITASTSSSWALFKWKF